MTTRYFGAPLEQRCIQPGHWLIEGYHVYRCRDGVEVFWEIFRGEPSTAGRRAQTAVSLGDARAWISDQIR